MMVDRASRVTRYLLDQVHARTYFRHERSAARAGWWDEMLASGTRTADVPEPLAADVWKIGLRHADGSINRVVFKRRAHGRAAGEVFVAEAADALGFGHLAARSLPERDRSETVSIEFVQGPSAAAAGVDSMAQLARWLEQHDLQRTRARVEEDKPVHSLFLPPSPGYPGFPTGARATCVMGAGSEACQSADVSAD